MLFLQGDDDKEERRPTELFHRPGEERRPGMTPTPPSPSEEDEHTRRKIHGLACQVAEKLGIYTSVIREQDVRFRRSPIQDDPLVDAYDVEVQAQMEQGTLHLGITYHLTGKQWKAKLLWWTTAPAGIYYIKDFAPNDSDSAWPRLSLYSTSWMNRGVSAGHAVLVGRTAEAPPRPVYQLYDRAPSEGADGRRRIEGLFVLEKRRLALLPANTPIHLAAEGQQKES